MIKGKEMGCEERLEMAERVEMEMEMKRKEGANGAERIELQGTEQREL
jgi:hypothetical protein